jgi:hypothetical protein
MARRRRRADPAESADSAAERVLSSRIAPVVALCVCCKSMLFSARAKAAGRFVRDPVRLASLLSSLASFGALAEFLFNPLFGKVRACKIGDRNVCALVVVVVGLFSYLRCFSVSLFLPLSLSLSPSPSLLLCGGFIFALLLSLWL